MVTEYDVAISFAGEDRAVAQQLADILVNDFGLLVFYDDYEQAALWGKILTEKLIDIYCNKARFCMVLISQSYKEKRWTKHEWRSAQQRAFLEPDRDYLLPVKLDDTVLDGMFQTMGYMDARKVSVRRIARLTFEKIGDLSKIKNKIRLADQKYKEGLIDEVIELLDDSCFDEHIEALRLKGSAYGRQCDYVNAVRSLKLILQEQPRDFLAHFLLGIFCYRKRDFRNSVFHFEIAEQLSPNHPTIQSDLPIARKKLAEEEQKRSC